MKGDLHVHTTISDGSYSTKEVIDMAKNNKLTHIGIVNHDTVCGLREAIEYGDSVGIKVIPGIEISAYDFKNKRKVHILGYNFNLDAKNITKLCSPLLEERDKNSRWQIDRILAEGYDLNLKRIEELTIEGTAIYKQHIMKELKNKHYTNSIYSKLYTKLFKNNGICSRDIEYVDALDAVKAIKDDEGYAVLAHPGQLNSYDMVEILVGNGLEGIEINHEDHNKSDIKKIKDLAKKYGLFCTGGSDFHGEYGKSTIKIGDIFCPNESLLKLEKKIGI